MKKKKKPTNRVVENFWGPSVVPVTPHVSEGVPGPQTPNDAFASYRARALVQLLLAAGSPAGTRTLKWKTRTEAFAELDLPALPNLQPEETLSVPRLTKRPGFYKANRGAENLDMTTLSGRERKLYDFALRREGNLDLFTDGFYHGLDFRTLALATAQLVDERVGFDQYLSQRGVKLRDTCAPSTSLVLYDASAVRVLHGTASLDVLSVISPKMSVRVDRRCLKVRLCGLRIVFYAITGALEKHLDGWWARQSSDLPKHEQQAVRAAVRARVRGNHSRLNFRRVELSPSPQDIRRNWSGLSYLQLALWALESRHSEPPTHLTDFTTVVLRHSLEAFLSTAVALTPKLKSFALGCERRAQTGQLSLQGIDSDWDSVLPTGPVPQSMLIELGRLQRVPVHDAMSLSGLGRKLAAHQVVAKANDAARLADPALQMQLARRQKLVNLFPDIEKWPSECLLNSILSGWAHGELSRLKHLPWCGSNAASLTFSRRVWGSLEATRSIGSAIACLATEITESFHDMRRAHRAIIPDALRRVVAIINEQDIRSESEKAHDARAATYKSWYRGFMSRIKPIFEHRKCRRTDCPHIHLHPRVFFDTHLFQREGKSRTLGRITDEIMPFFRLYSKMCRSYTSQMPGQEEATQGLKRTTVRDFNIMMTRTNLDFRNADAISSTNNITPDAADAILVETGKGIDSKIGDGLIRTMRDIHPDLSFEAIAEMHGMPCRPFLLNLRRPTMTPFWNIRSDSDGGNEDRELSWNRALSAAAPHENWPQVRLDGAPGLPGARQQAFRLFREFKEVRDLLVSKSPICAALPCTEKFFELGTLATSSLLLFQCPTGGGKTSVFLVGVAMAVEAMVICVCPTVLALIGAAARARKILEMCGLEIEVTEVYAELGSFVFGTAKIIFTTPFHPSIITQKMRGADVWIVLDEPEQYAVEAILIRDFAIGHPNMLCTLMSATLPDGWKEWAHPDLIYYEITKSDTNLATRHGKIDTLRSVVEEWKGMLGNAALFFCLSRKEMDERAVSLGSSLEGLDIRKIHGVLVNEELQAIMAEEAAVKTMFFCTDICTTSISVPGCTLVIDPGTRRGNAFDPSTLIEQPTVWRSSEGTTAQRRGRADRHRGPEGKLYPSIYFVLQSCDRRPAEPGFVITRKSIDSHPLGNQLLTLDAPIPFRTRIRAAQISGLTPEYKYDGPKMSPWVECCLTELRDHHAGGQNPFSSGELVYAIAWMTLTDNGIWGQPYCPTGHPGPDIATILQYFSRPSPAGVGDAVWYVFTTPFRPFLNSQLRSAAAKFTRICTWIFRDSDAGLIEMPEMTEHLLAQMLQPILKFPHLLAYREKDSFLMRLSGAEIEASRHLKTAGPGEAIFVAQPWTVRNGFLEGTMCLRLGKEAPRMPVGGAVKAIDLNVRETHIDECGSVRTEKSADWRAAVVGRTSAAAIARQYLRDLDACQEDAGDPDPGSDPLIFFLNLASPMTGKVLQALNTAGRNLHEFLQDRWTPEAEEEFPGVQKALDQWKTDSTPPRVSKGFGDDSSSLHDPAQSCLVELGDCLAPFVNGPASVSGPFLRGGNHSGAALFECERLWVLNSHRKFEEAPSIKPGTIARVWARLMVDVLPIDLDENSNDFQAAHSALPECEATRAVTDIISRPKLACLASFAGKEAAARYQLSGIDLELPDGRATNADESLPFPWDKAPDVAKAHFAHGPVKGRTSLYDRAKRMIAGEFGEDIQLIEPDVLRAAVLELVRSLRISMI